MSMTVCLMAGRQAGAIGVLTTLAKKIDVLAIVAYDEIVEMISEELNIPVYNSIHDKEFIEHLTKSDILISIHGREIVSEDILNLPKICCINVHPCLYKYKGKDPIKRFLKHSNSKASVGVHYMTEEIDEGEVILEEFVDVEGIDGVESIYNALYPYYFLAISKSIDNIINKWQERLKKY